MVLADWATKGSSRSKRRERAEWAAKGLKRCMGCGEGKAFAEFTRAQKSRDGRYHLCRPCLKADRRKRYDPVRQRIRDYERVSARMLELKGGRSCARCGEAHPGTLDFHHRDPAQKLFILATVNARARDQEEIAAEIAKCDVLCANCHRKLHWEQTDQAYQDALAMVAKEASDSTRPELQVIFDTGAMDGS